MQKSTVSELVDQVFACPVCHNNVMDNLVCQDDDNVKCSKCGTDYNPLNKSERKIHWRSYVWYRIKFCGDRL